MNVLLLVVALAAPVEAPKAELHEVAAASAAVASVQVVPEAHSSPLAATDTPTLREAWASVAAKSGECQVREVGTGEPCALRESVSLKAVTAAPVVEPRRLAPLPEPKTGTGCDLVSLFETRRFLSAPWSASRRIKAARLRGDTDEARRMEARLGELVEEALGVE